MTSTATNEGPGAKRARRLVSRALLVLGGAVAGTAAAWLVSTATASADTADTVVTPVTDATVGGLSDVNDGTADVAGDVAGGLTDAACHQDATTWSAPAGGSCGAHEVSEHVSGSVSELAGSVVLRPAHRALGAVEQVARTPAETRRVIEEAIAPEPAPDLSRQVLQLLAPAALPGAHPVEPARAAQPARQATAPVAVSTVELPAASRAVLVTPSGHQHDDVTGAAGESRTSHRDLPSPLVPAQLPVAPSVPTAPGGSSAPGGHLDGLNFGVPSWVSAAVGNAAACAYRGGLRHTPRTPGTQPGVTPD